MSAVALKKLLEPIAQVGSVYFLERDLSEPMPQLRPVPGIVAREGTLSDIALLDETTDATKRKLLATERLEKGDRWFLAVEDRTGRLTNYRWVSTTTAFIPELDRELIVAPGEAYFYDLETLPEFRRRGIEAVTRQYAYDFLFRECAMNRVIVYICADNNASLNAARRYLTPIRRVWYARTTRGVHVFMHRSHRMPLLRPKSMPVNVGTRQSTCTTK